MKVTSVAALAYPWENIAELGMARLNDMLIHEPPFILTSLPTHTYPLWTHDTMTNQWNQGFCEVQPSYKPMTNPMTSHDSSDE